MNSTIETIEEKLNKEIDYFLKTSKINVSSKQVTYEKFLEDKMLIVVAIRKGIPYSLFDLIQKYTPFSENDWANFLDLSTKSLQRYRASPEHHFKPIHSEKIIEIAEVTKVGLDVFGNVEKLNLLLNTPSFALGKLKPIELLKDSYGKEMVISELHRMNYGIFVQMKVFRISRGKYATPLSGEGAAKYGARWNPVGIGLIYTAQNRSLAMAEVAVHLTLATLPDDYMILTIDIPDDIKIKQLTETDLPEDWQEFPHPFSTQNIGREFVTENEFCVLIIPTVVTKGD